MTTITVDEKQHDESNLTMLAAKLSLPDKKYLYFYETNKATNLWALISEENDHFDTVLDSKYMKKAIEQKYFNICHDVIEPLIAYKTKGIKSQEEENFFFLMVGENQTKTLDKLIKTHKCNLDGKDGIMKIRKTIVKKFETKIEDLKKEAKEAREKESKIIPPEPTPFEIERSIFELKINSDQELLTLFDRIRCSPELPWCTTSDFYKTLTNFNPPLEWVGQRYDNTLSLYVLSNGQMSLVKIIKQNGSLKVLFDLKNPKDSNPVIDTVLNNINEKKIVSKKGLKMTGVFYIKNQTLDKYVLADLIMNDSKDWYINDSIKATKDKPSLRVHFKTHQTYVVAELTQQSKEQLYGDNYIRVKIGFASDLNSITLFIKNLTYLFGKYNNEYTNIVTYYQKYIKDFAKKETEKKKKKKKKKKEERLFFANYTRECTHPPRVVTSEEAKTYENVLVYPKDADRQYLEQKMYVCDYKEYKYPGLKDAKNKPSDFKLPFIPCCYKKNQQEKKSSLFHKYYSEKEIPFTKQIRQQNIIKTNKMVGKDLFGYLPTPLKNMFNIIDKQQDLIFLRKGVIRNKKSFLTCVQDALQIKEEITLESLKPYAPLARQVMFDSTLKEIEDKLLNPTTYMDPSLFYRLLEIKYKCQIFIFSPNQMIIPRHRQAFLTTQRTDVDKVILIYEHMGSESDHAQYPQCELIVRWEEGKESNLTYSFPFSSKTSTALNQIYDRLIRSYSLNKLNQPIKLPPSLKPTSQYIDSQGKARILYIGGASLLIDPIPPLEIDIETKPQIKRVELKEATSLATKLNLTNIITNNNLAQVEGSYEGINIRIPIKTKKHNQTLTKFNQSKRFARYIVQYVFWLFSKYLYERKALLSNKTIDLFAIEKLKIKTDFLYKPLSIKFDTKSTLFDDNKLILKSSEVLQRIIFILRREIELNPRLIENYKDKTHIENYYHDITDFEQHPREIILKGTLNITHWIKNKNRPNYILYDHIRPAETKSYWFKNENISSDIFLARNYDTLNEALKEANYKNDTGYTLFIYTNNREIRKIKTKPQPSSIKIIAWKYKDKKHFTLLL